MKLTRTDTNDRLDRLQRSYTEFAQKVAENNSRALIQALQEVIRDFNTKISEQFGDNFKQLNEAVGSLLNWQDSYRTQIGEMIEQQSVAAANMKTATEQYTTLVSKAEIFSTISTQLTRLLTGLDTQRTQLQGSLESLARLLSAASGSLPQIESKIVELTEQVTFGVKQNQDQMTKVVRDAAVTFQGAIEDSRKLLFENMQTVNRQVNDHMKELADKTTELTEQVTFGVKQNQDQMARVVRDAAVTFQGAIEDSRKLLFENMQTVNRQVNDHMKELADKTTEQLVKLDTALETELSKSISSLGRQLTALSRRFVEDYTPLTDRLRSLLQGVQRA